MGIEDRIESLRRRIEMTPKNVRGRRQYAKSLRADLVAHVRQRVAAGLSQSAVAKELGLTQRVVWGWMRERATKRVKPVEVVDAESTLPAGFVVSLGRNVRVEGLSVGQLVQLAKELA